MQKIQRLSIVALLLTVIVLSGCQTVDGVGRDIENMGESVQDSSN